MTHSDHDASERRIQPCTCMAGTPLVAPGVLHEIGCAAPAGLPLHESADRDADNVPSDRVRAYAEAIRREDAWALFHPIARAVMAVADREQAELRGEVERLSGNLSALLCDLTGGRLSKTNYDVRTMVTEVEAHFEEVGSQALADAEAAWAAERATIARVAALAKVNATSAHALGHEDERRRWLDLLAILERAALRGPEPTEATSNEDAPGLDVGADAPTPVGAEQTDAP